MQCSHPLCDMPIATNSAITRADSDGHEYSYCSQPCQAHHHLTCVQPNASYEVVRNWYRNLPQEWQSEVLGLLPPQQAMRLALS
jgi:YHS domain-containing protein